MEVSAMNCASLATRFTTCPELFGQCERKIITRNPCAPPRSTLSDRSVELNSHVIECQSQQTKRNSDSRERSQSMHCRKSTPHTNSPSTRVHLCRQSKLVGMATRLDSRRKRGRREPIVRKDIVKELGIPLPSQSLSNKFFARLDKERAFHL